MENTNKIGQDFTTFGLFKFALPAFFTNFFTQLFKSLDDALFISRYSGTTALAALNILAPLDCVRLALCHLCSLGSATISAKYMGEKKQLEAKQVFTKVCIATIIVGAVFGLATNIFAKPLVFLFGADDTLYSLALYQLRLVYGISPIVILNSVFALYFSTAGQPKMGTICSIVNGTINIVLDIILIPYLKLGVLGAAIATAAGEIVVFIIGLFFFLNKNNEIHFVKPEGEILEPVLKTFKYALPQCINSLSFSVTSFIVNDQLMRLAGADGVAASAIIGDIRSIVMSGLVGISASIGPVIAFNFGNGDVERLRTRLFSALKIWLIGSCTLMMIGFLIRTPLVQLFMAETNTKAFYDMTFLGLTIEIFSIPFAEGCIMTSRVFISLSNTRTSTILSICRNLIFRAFSLIILPNLFGVNGVWFAIPFAEFLAFLFACVLIYVNRNNYGYGKSHEAYMLKWPTQLHR